VTSFQDIELLWQFPSPHDSSELADASIQSALEFVQANQIRALLWMYEPQAEPVVAAISENAQVSVEPVVPNMTAYVRDTADRGIIGAALVRFKRLGLLEQACIMWHNVGRAHRVIAKDFNTGLLLLVEMELAKFRKWRPTHVFLHPSVTDLALALDNKKLFVEYAHLIRRVYRLKPGLMTHNYGRLAPELRNWNVEVDAIVGPFNRKGYLMNPSQEECEHARRESSAQVIASHIDAGGTLDLAVSAEYLRELNIRKALINYASSG